MLFDFGIKLNELLFIIIVLNIGMVPHFFKKKQQAFGQFCHCSLASNSNSYCQQGQKFLTRLQAQPLRPKVQVKETVKSRASKKQRETKLSLKPREKKPMSTQNFHRIDKTQSDLTFSNQRQMTWNYPQNTKNTNVTTVQEEQYTFLQLNALRQELGELKLGFNQQTQSKRTITQKSTMLSNITHLKNSIETIAIRDHNKNHYSEESSFIYANSQQTAKLVTDLPRNKAFSTNLTRNKSIIDDLYFKYEESRTFNNNFFNEQPSKVQNPLESLKFTDLVFKSAQSISESSSEKKSELANSNEYRSHPSINESSWSNSLNQILAKRTKRLSHNPNA